MSKEVIQKCDRCGKLVTLDYRETHQIPESFRFVYLSVYTRDKERVQSLCEQVEVCDACADKMYISFNQELKNTESK